MGGNKIMNNFDYITKYGSNGTGNSNLDNPLDLAIDYNLRKIAISDSGNSRIVVRNLQGLSYFDKKSTFGHSLEYDLDTPAGICYFDGNYFVCDTARHVVIRYRALDMKYIQHFGTIDSSGSTTSLLSSPKGVCSDGQYLYVTDSGNDRIMKLTLKNMDYVSKSTLTLSGPCGICYDKILKCLYVVDQSNNQVLKLSKSFVQLDSIGSVGDGDGEFTVPTYCDVIDDKLYVVDSQNDRIQVIATGDMSYITEDEGNGDGNDEYDTPYGICCSGNLIFSSDIGNDRIKVTYDYNPRRSFTQATTAKADSSNVFDVFSIILDKDELIVGDTDEYGTPNRWIEEPMQSDKIGWEKE